MAIGRAVEAREAEKAKARQATSTGGKKPTLKPEVRAASENVPQAESGRAKDKAAAAVGVSRPTYEKAKAVVEAAERDPVLAPVVEAMDRTGNVSGVRAPALVSERRCRRGTGTRRRPGV